MRPLSRAPGCASGPGIPWSFSPRLDVVRLPNENSWVTVRASAGVIRAPRLPRVRPKTAVAPEVRRRLAWLVSVLGNNQVAELLGVSRSQPSRWRTGKEGLAAENRRDVGGNVLGARFIVRLPAAEAAG